MKTAKKTFFLCGDRIAATNETGNAIAVTQQRGRYSVSLSSRDLDEAIGALMVVAELAGWSDPVLSFPAGRVEIRRHK